MIEIGTDWRARFVCDVCKKPIDKVGKELGTGIVIFDPKTLPRFQIVHKGYCDSGLLSCWMNCEQFIDELHESLNLTTAGIECGTFGRKEK